jgi:pyruvate/2-oxoglutarate dehydrogenase complex dihydrolipoamide dehydrogenase (E3) component
MDIIVIGAGPSGLIAALRAAQLGAQTTLVTRGAFGGMAANDGPVPVRVLAHTARLVRESRQLEQSGISSGEFQLDYSRLLGRVQQVVDQVRTHSAFRPDLERAGVVIREHAGTARFIDAHTIESEHGPRLRADRIILCVGGTSRALSVPGVELTATHSDAWELTSVPPSMLVIGAGATGVQVASVFNALGSRVQLFAAGPRILTSEDEDVSAAVVEAFRAGGMTIHEEFGSIERFEETDAGVRMLFARDGHTGQAEATIAVVATGWQADTLGLNLPAAGVNTTPRGYVAVDAHLRTSVPHIFAAGDVTGRLMLVPQAIHDGFAAATNAVRGPTVTLGDQVSPIGSFTDPEYAQVGLTEAQARVAHDVLVATVPYATVARPIIDGRTVGFCKLIVDRGAHTILGCHIVGERAVEMAQVAAVAMAAHMRVQEFARIPLSFPTYTNVLGRAVIMAAKQLHEPGLWDAEELAERGTGGSGGS